jgi:hypothetical protein
MLDPRMEVPDVACRLRCDCRKARGSQNKIITRPGPSEGYYLLSLDPGASSANCFRSCCPTVWMSSLFCASVSSHLNRAGEVPGSTVCAASMADCLVAYPMAPSAALATVVGCSRVTRFIARHKARFQIGARTAGSRPSSKPSKRSSLPMASVRRRCAPLIGLVILFDAQRRPGAASEYIGQGGGGVLQSPLHRL